MTRAQQALALATEHHVHVSVEGGALRLAAPEEPPEVVLSCLRDAKREIIELLEHGVPKASLEELVADTERRARAAVSEPGDGEDATEAEAERAALQHESEFAEPQSVPHERMVVGLMTLATLRAPSFHANTTQRSAKRRT